VPRRANLGRKKKKKKEKKSKSEEDLRHGSKRRTSKSSITKHVSISCKDVDIFFNWPGCS
jgi:hypothetical protein